MKNMRTAPLFGALSIALAALLTGCGGGGGGGGGGSSPVHAPVPPAPVPTATPGGTGQLVLNGTPLANDSVVFTCGCTGDGGKISTDGSGNYTVTGSAPSVLSPGTSYVPNGHNLMIVGYTGTTQVWTMLFLGNSPATNLNLSNTPATASANVSDTASTAAALYVYYAAGTQVSGGDHTFDWFNFNQIIAFAQHLRSAPDAHEQTLLTDIAAAQTAGQSLYPGFVPQWNIVTGEGVNAKITADVKQVAADGPAADSTLPVPCSAPNACTGAPTP